MKRISETPLADELFHALFSISLAGVSVRSIPNGSTTISRQLGRDNTQFARYSIPRVTLGQHDLLHESFFFVSLPSFGNSSSTFQFEIIVVRRSRVDNLPGIISFAAFSLFLLWLCLFLPDCSTVFECFFAISIRIVASATMFSKDVQE